MTTVILKSHLAFFFGRGGNYILTGRMTKRFYMCHRKEIGLISVMGKTASGEEGTSFQNALYPYQEPF